MGPLVSVVIPSFQQARFLREAIDSVLSQSYGRIEVLVVDGGSTDGSVEVLNGYGPRIWYRSRADGGQAQAINEGFRRSRGELLAWLNSDDFYYPGAVETAVAALTRHRDAALVYGEGNLVDERGALLGRFPETVPFDLWRLLHVADYILQPTVFMRRDALFRSGLLDESLRWGFDWDLWIRLGQQRPLVHVPELLAASRLHGATKTATGGVPRLRELLRMLRAHGVRAWSPAAVAHGITTAVRACRPGQGPITAERLAAAAPGFLAAPVRAAGDRLERGLRSWLESAQGVWRDGMVGRIGRLWLPSEGAPATLRVTGRNLDLDGQVVRLRSAAAEASSPPLRPGAGFELEVAVRAGAGPVKAQLTCDRVQRVPPLSNRLRGRRAGWRLHRAATT